jgi:hypothetical protein
MRTSTEPLSEAAAGMEGAADKLTLRIFDRARFENLLCNKGTALAGPKDAIRQRVLTPERFGPNPLVREICPGYFLARL